jgi:translation initiation factor IF-2
LDKVRVYDLAKEYGMKGPELAKVLRKLGFEKIKSHMAVLDAADQMMMVARLEAQGFARVDTRTEVGETETKKKLPGRPEKKTLPPPVVAKELVRKKLPGEAEPPAPEPLRKERAEVEAALEAEGLATELEPEVATPPSPPPARPAPPVEVRKAPEVEPEPAPRSVEPVAPREAEAAPAPAEPVPAAEQRAEPREEEQPAPAAAAAAAPKAPARAEPRPEVELPERQVKKLLVPKAKAQVVGRIDLPQETIRDATRRSAPAGERSADTDRKLRRMALQSTQSRTASRATGTRRGPATGVTRAGGRRDGRGLRGRQKTGLNAPTVDLSKVVEIQPPARIKDLSEALGIKVTELIRTLAFKLGVMGKTINSFLTPEEVELVALEMGRNIKVVERREAEDELIQNIVKDAADETEQPRAPVITFMGHVDHGKTTLLDALRQSDVVKSEAGGITQHIGAYKVTPASGHPLVVLDTPGHAAFTSMRARGASLTDIVVLVVAADDGVMPQTEEAIAHARDAKVPIVVAITKCDKPNANPMQVRQQLAVKGLQPEEWGGNVQMVDVSAITGRGLGDLIEKIHLEAELLELRAKPSANGVGVVIESKQTPEQGVVVNVLVTNGTLRVKDRVLVGESLSRIRGLTDDHGHAIDEAGPSTPVTVMGIDELPQPGDHLYVITDVRDIKKAKEVAADRQRRSRDLSLAERSSVTLENLSAALAAAETAEIKIILKADVMGSLEPIKRVLTELNTAEVKVNLIHAALGGITENDVALGAAGGAIVIGFNSVPDQAARIAAERAGVEIKFYDVIYNLVDDIKKTMEGMLAPDEVEQVTGHAEVRAVFRSSKFGNIAGCYVLDGTIARGQKVRLSRDGRIIYHGPLAGLRRVKDDVKEVKAGFECGMTFANFNDIKVGDQVEAYDVELVKRTLD